MSSVVAVAVAVDAAGAEQLAEFAVAVQLAEFVVAETEE